MSKPPPPFNKYLPPNSPKLPPYGAICERKRKGRVKIAFLPTRL